MTTHLVKSGNWKVVREKSGKLEKVRESYIIIILQVREWQRYYRISKISAGIPVCKIMIITVVMKAKLISNGIGWLAYSNLYQRTDYR